MRFKFTYNTNSTQWNYDKKTVTVESSSVTLDELLEDFKDFLAGCGYQVQGKELAVLEPLEAEKDQ